VWELVRWGHSHIRSRVTHSPACVTVPPVHGVGCPRMCHGREEREQHEGGAHCAQGGHSLSKVAAGEMVVVHGLQYDGGRQCSRSDDDRLVSGWLCMVAGAMVVVGAVVAAMIGWLEGGCAWSPV
jgi:hypothetical protein